MTMRNKRYEVLWTDSAALDLNAILDFVARQDRQAAGAIFQGIRLKATTLSCFPERGRVVPELQAQSIAMYRELLHKAWRIVFRIEGNRVFVLAVLDARRNVEDLLLDRLIR